MPKTAEELAVAAKLKDKGLPTEESPDEEVLEEVDEEGEEVIVEDEETGEIDEDTPDQEPEWTEEELIAKEAGWKPQDEWDGDPDEWVSAKQFNRNGEYLRKIHNQNRKLKQLDDVVTNLAKQQQKIFIAGYDKAKRELKMALREANKEGDDATADAIEQRMELLEQQRQADAKEVALPQQSQTPEIAPEFVSWVGRNKWFVEKPELRVFAEAVGVNYAQKNPNKTNTEVYQHVTNEVKKRFPEEFGEVRQPQKRKPGSPVVGGGDLTATRSSGAPVRVSLSPEEKAVGRILVEKGAYKNLNEYATELRKFGVKSK